VNETDRLFEEYQKRVDAAFDKLARDARRDRSPPLVDVSIYAWLVGALSGSLITAILFLVFK
jgi:hypothetical protein